MFAYCKRLTFLLHGGILIVMESFKEALLRELQAAGVSQAEAARMSGLSQGMLNQMTKGKRHNLRLETVAKLVQAFPRLIVWAVSYLVGEPK